MKYSNKLFNQICTITDSYYSAEEAYNGKVQYRHVTEPLTLAVVNDDSVSVVVRMLNSKNEVDKIVFDIDLDSKNFGTLGDARTAMQHLTSVLTNVYEIDRWYVIESGKKGYHVWIFLDDWINAVLARSFARTVLKTLGASDRVNIEIFPKQDVLYDGMYGNGIKIPYQIHRATGYRSGFIDARTLEVVHVDSVEKVDISKIVALTDVSQIPTITVRPSSDIYNTQESIESLEKNCELIKAIKNKSEEVQHTVGHNRRLFLGSTYRQLGDEGVERVHQILSQVADDYDRSTTDKHIRSLTRGPMKCSSRELACPFYESGKGCSALQKLQRERGRKSPYVSPSAFFVRKRTNDSKKMSDVRYRNEMLEDYKDQIKYNDGLGWVVWNGKYYSIDPSNDAVVADMIDNMASEKGFEALEGDARKSAVMRQLKQTTQVKFGNVMDYLDRQKHLYNVRNGTIDLRDGTLLQHDMKHKISMYSDVYYDPEAESQLWQEVLDKVTGRGVSGRSDSEIDELQHWLQLAVGYSITGETSEQVFFVLHGRGGTGKGTFMKGLEAICGIRDNGYYSAFDTKHLLSLGRDSVGHNDHIASLLSKRVIHGNEVEQDRALNEQLIRRLTGGSPIQVSKKGRSTFTMELDGKFWIDLNDMFKIIEDGKNTTSRRLIKVDFDIMQDNSDSQIYNKIKNESAGILRWAVEGAKRWYAGESVKDLPAIVKRSVDTYLGEMDRVKQFLMECVEFDSNSVIKSRHLTMVFAEWSKKNGYHGVGSNSLISKLRGKDYLQGKNIRYGMWKKHGSTMCLSGMKFNKEGFGVLPDSMMRDFTVTNYDREGWEGGELL